MTVSAPVKLTPTPPERVERMKQKILLSALKRSIMACKFSPGFVRGFFLAMRGIPGAARLEYCRRDGSTGSRDVRGKSEGCPASSTFA